MVKDRVYAGDVEIRLHTQTILMMIKHELTHMLAPITPLLMEEVWEHTPANQKENILSPNQRIWDHINIPEFDHDPEEVERDMQIFQTVSSAVKAAQEKARQRGKLGSGLACSVEIVLPENVSDDVHTLLDDLETEEQLSEMLVVSEASVLPGDEETRRAAEADITDEQMKAVYAMRREWRDNVAWEFSAEFECGTEEQPATGKAVVLPPAGEKCDRCWQYTADEEMAEQQVTLCQRCADVLGVTIGDDGEEGEGLDDEDDDDEDDDDEDDEDDGGEPAEHTPLRRRPMSSVERTKRFA